MTNQEKRMKQIGFILIGVAMLAQPLFAQQTKELDILHTSDTHSRIEPIDPQAADKLAGLGGVLRRVAFVKQFRQEHPDMLLFDGGDFSQGTPYYNLFRGELEVQMMNLMRYDAVTIGNHEFDFGLENMARLYRMARFPVVCANYEFNSPALGRLVSPCAIIRRAGLKIGFIGLLTDLTRVVDRPIADRITYLDPIEVTNRYAAWLKEKKHCDLVICLSHLGYEKEPFTDRDLVAATRNVDIVIGGHSHTFLETEKIHENIDGEPVLIVTDGCWGLYVGNLKISLDNR